MLDRNGFVSRLWVYICYGVGLGYGFKVGTVVVMGSVLIWVVIWYGYDGFGLKTGLRF